MRILISCATYLPGYKGGGPIRTIANLVEQLGDEHEMLIVTRDRDFGDSEPYAVTTDEWLTVGKAKVRYLSQKGRRPLALARAIREARPDVLYLNSLFDPRFSIQWLVLRRFGLIGKAPVILAPRGECAPSALSLKSKKKALFLMLAKRLGLLKGVLVQGSTGKELDQIADRLPIQQFGYRTAVATDLGPNLNWSPDALPIKKQSGELNLIFLSRICRMKNLHFALQQLRQISGTISLDIFGPKEDIAYWEQCFEEIKSLPGNVTVRFRGPVPNREVADVIRNYHAFILPTLGENFGHVIGEALMVGCPVILSDQTPWRDLVAKGCGWDLPLSQPEQFRNAIQFVCDCNQEEWQKLSDAARTFAQEQAADPIALDANRKLFELAINPEIGLGNRVAISATNHSQKVQTPL